MRRYSRLLRMGPQEVGGRLLQKLHAHGDRLRAAVAGPTEASDALFRRAGIRTSADGAGSPGLWQAFRERAPRAPFPGLCDPAGTMAVAQRRCPQEVERILHRAREVANGRISLLGREIPLGPSIDWHLEPVSGKKVPLRHWTKVDHLDPEVAGEYKVLWELNRHQYFLALGQAYALTGEEKYPRIFRDHLVSWMDQNPPSWGIHWSSSLELSYRAIAWIWSLYLFRDSDLIDEDFYLRCLMFLSLQGRHIERYLSTFFSPNTHLTGEALGLLYLGVCFPELSRADHWRRMASQVLRQQLGIQVREDGTHFEQASAYHAYTLDIYLHADRLISHLGHSMEEASKARLLKALEFLRSLVRPDGLIPLLGDDDGGRLLPIVPRSAADFSDLLSVGGFLFRRGDLLSVSPQPTLESLFILGVGVAEDGLEPCPPSGVTRAFPDGGFFVLRDGWGRHANYAVLSCGPHGSIGGGHAHADALSVEVTVRGAPLVVDPGTFTYRSDSELRASLRGAGAHNSVVVDDRPNAVPGGPFSWRSSADARMEHFISRGDFDFFQGVVHHPGRSERGVQHRRCIFFSRDRYFLVWDRIEGSGQHSVDVGYHLASNVQPEIKGDGLLCYRAGAPLAEFTFFGSGEGEVELLEAPVCHGYGEKMPSTAVRWRQEGVGTQDVVTLLNLDPLGLTVERLPLSGSALSLRLKHAMEVEILMLDQLGPFPEGVLPASFPDMYAEARLLRLSKGPRGAGVKALALLGRRFQAGAASLLDGSGVTECQEWELSPQPETS